MDRGGLSTTPVSKGLLALTALGSAVGFFVKRQTFGLALGSQLWWRLFTSQFLFGTMGELLLGLLLLVSLRHFERTFGGRKFAAAAVIFVLLSTTFQVIILLLFSEIGPLASGPFAVIFGLMSSFVSDVPALRRHRVFVFTVSDKMITYLLAAQLAFANVPANLISAGCGFAAGLFWRIGLLRMDQLRCPESVNSCCRRTVLPVLVPGNRGGAGYAAIPAAGGAMGPVDAAEAEPFGQPAVAEADADAPAAAEASGSRDAAEVAPDENAVATLTGMGFAEPDVRAVLARCQNSVSVASQRLVEMRHGEGQ